MTRSVRCHVLKIRALALGLSWKVFNPVESDSVVKRVKRARQDICESYGTKLSKVLLTFHVHNEIDVASNKIQAVNRSSFSLFQNHISQSR